MKPIIGVFELKTDFIFVSKPLGNLSLVFLNLRPVSFLYSHLTGVFLINPFSAGTVFIRQNLTSVDVRF